MLAIFAGKKTGKKTKKYFTGKITSLVNGSRPTRREKATNDSLTHMVYIKV